MLLLGTSGSERSVLPPRAMVTSGPQLLLMTTAGSMVLQQLESVWMSIAYVVTGAQANHVLKYIHTSICIEVYNSPPLSGTELPVPASQES